MAAETKSRPLFLAAAIASCLTAALMAPTARAAATTRPSVTGPFSRAVVVPIKDEITDITKDSVDRRLKLVREQHIPLVIFEFDTPGGALGPMLDICQSIKALRDSGIKTVSWVNSEAYSAGTIIALATDEIVMTSNATIGDCKPITMSPEGGAAALPAELEAKATSPVLAELRDSVRRNGYNWDMVLSLIRERVHPFWLVNTETGEKRFVDPTGRDELFGLPAATSRPSESDNSRVPDSMSKTPWRYVQEAPGLDHVPQPIVPDRELLTMRTVEAVAYGFAHGTVNNQAELTSRYAIGNPIERMDSTWFEGLVAWLASPMVRGVLFLLMLLGAYAEFQHPGMSFPGAVAVVALLLFLGAPYLAGFTVPWEIVVILLGLLLIALEIFVIPGFGVAGVAGAVLLTIGLLSSFVPQEPGTGDWPHLPQFPMTYEYLRKALWALAGGLTGSLFGMLLIAKYMPRVPLAKGLIAANPTREQITVADPYDGAAVLGDIGKTEGPLRPAGKARFGATLVDVVSDGEFIDKGMRVEVVERCGNRVVVRRVD